MQSNLAFLGQAGDDLCFELGTVDSRLPEGSSVAILLPVVMPVSLLVCTITKH